MKTEHVQTQTSNAMQVFRTQLMMQRGDLAAMLPAHVSIEKFQRIVLTAVAINPALLDANRRSLFLACQKAASDGLLPDGREAALVIYNDKNSSTPVVQYQPMYQGLLKVVRNSGDLASINAHPVFPKDRFSYTLGDDEKIVHVPYLGAEDPGDAVAVYAIATTKDGARYRLVMSRGQVEKVRAVSRAKNSFMWTQFWEEGAKKTVLRRLSKMLPKSTDREVDTLERVLANDPDTDEMPAIEHESAPPKPTRESVQIEHSKEQTFDPETGEVIEFEGIGTARVTVTSADEHVARARFTPGGEQRLAEAGGTEPDAKAAPRRRAAPAPKVEPIVEPEVDESEAEADRRVAPDRLAPEDDEPEDDGSAAWIIAVPRGENNKPDSVAWQSLVSAKVATIKTAADLLAFDNANQDAAKALGAGVFRSYRLSIARATQAIGG